MSDLAEKPGETHDLAENEGGLTDWPLRPWVLAATGALAGYAIWWLIDDGSDAPWRLGLASFAFFTAVAAGFTLRPRDWIGPVVFALGLGLVMGGIAWMAARANDSRAGEEFAFAAGVFFSILAVPLFQAGFHRTRFATPYRETHFHVWTDVVSAGGAFAFMLLSYALLWFLHGLFSLVGIEIIEELIQDGWFLGLFFGATFGAALGVIRNNLKVLGALQGVVLIVFSLLAVPFAVAILIFLVLLLASGGQALWEATDDATPVLLTCAVGCFVLANSVIRDDDEARSGSRVMQVAAAVLAAAILPLSLFAAISMGIRIDQYGLAPERIWALVAIVVAVTYGIAYWAGLARGRLAGWSAYLRQANLHLAAATCVLALLLALPILDFGAISARNQVARLESGRVTPEEFDFAALRWDFGDAGRRALDRLADGEGEVAELASQARDAKSRPYPLAPEARRTDFAFHTVPDDPQFRSEVESFLRRLPWACQQYCVVIDLGKKDDGKREIELVQQYNHLRFAFDEQTGECVSGGCNAGIPMEGEARAEPPALGPDSKVEIRTVPRRVIYIDGVPMREPLEDDPVLGKTADGAENLLMTVTTAE